MKPCHGMQIENLVLKMGNEDEQVISYVNSMHSETVILLSLFEGNREDWKWQKGLRTRPNKTNV